MSAHQHQNDGSPEPTQLDAHIQGPNASADDEVHLLDLLLPLAKHWRLLILIPFLTAVIAGAWTLFADPTFTSRTTFLPPQQQQSAGAAALASLGSLAGLAGAASIRTPADQFVTLLQSNAVRDPIIDRLDLMTVYGSKYRADARRRLDRSVRITVGKRDGLITIEADASTPSQAAELANRHVEELRRLTGELALSEAQQRRTFFEAQMRQTQAQLIKAQTALESSGVNAGALKAEPRAMAESYASIRAQVTAAEVRLAVLRRSLTDTSTEVLQQLSTLGALRGQLMRVESSNPVPNNENYIGRFREFKYQETLFELFARQYELARVDESKEGALIQVVDAATPPERRSKPRRAMVVGAATGAALLITAALLVLLSIVGRSLREPANAARLEHLKRSLARR